MFLFIPWSYHRFAWVLMLILNTCVNSAILFFSPQTLYYVGLSGTLHSLFCVGALLTCFKQKALGAVMLASVTVKIFLEQVYQVQSPAQAWIGTIIHYDAHFYGWSIGLTFGAMLFLSRNKWWHTDVFFRTNEAPSIR